MQDQAAVRENRKHTVRIQQMKTKYTNRVKVLVFYIVVWFLAVFLPIAGLVKVYPSELNSAAPAIAKHLAEAFPGASSWLQGYMDSAEGRNGTSQEAKQAADTQWCVFVGTVTAAAWLTSLFAQLCWRSFYVSPVRPARAARQAIHSYRLLLLAIILANLAASACIYGLGLRFVAGRTVWDWTLSMGGFALNIIAAFLSFRFAAPPSISGKRSFFRRL